MKKMIPLDEWVRKLSDLELDLLRRAIKAEQQYRRCQNSNIYSCTICGKNPVDATNGFDTCSDCLKKI